MSLTSYPVYFTVTDFVYLKALQVYPIAKFKYNRVKAERACL